MILFAFVTFAYGSYIVFNQPISNVVAVTLPLSSGGAVLEFDGAGFPSNSAMQVWVDPVFDPSNSALMNPSASFYIGNVTSDSNGNVPLQNMTIPSAELASISKDNFTVHYVVIMGVNQSAASAPYSDLTYDLQANYTAATVIPASEGIVFFVTLFTVQLPVSYTIGQLFLVLWVIFIILFAMALNGPSQSVIGALKKGYREGVSGIYSNSMFAVVSLFTVVLWGQDLLAYLQAAGGVSTGSLAASDPLLTFLSYAIAPIREELGFRVIPIGVAALLILWGRGRVRDGLMALWHPMRYLKKNDSPADYKRHQLIMYILIAISAALFGYAHVFFGGGWGIGKISEAAGAGVAFGVLYYQYGLPATILIHWAFDYEYGTYVFSGALYNASNYFVLFTIPVAIATTIVLFIMLGRRLQRRGAAKSSMGTGSLQGI
jgi:Type II CAAX prenyl endopeptidase Rce1-like